MGYSDFTFEKLRSKYGIEQQESDLFKDIVLETCLPSERLLADLEDARGVPLFSEKAKSENIISPIIRELKRMHPHITVFSGYALNIESDKDLSGTPDFLISAKSRIVEPQKPIFSIFESKNKAPEEGFAQCAAEMYAARVFNEQNGEPRKTIYGAVTNAFDWIFLKLENDTIYIDLTRYYLNQIPLLLGILDYIIKSSKP